MVTLEKAMELMFKYGFNSTSGYPYIYDDGQKFGLCYSFIDENYGYLERVKYFEDETVMEDFLRRLQWISVNGKNTNSRMMLDNYQVVDPKNMFLRNERIMMKGEMFSIDEFERKATAKEKMDPVSRALCECEDLIQIYDELKARQLNYYKLVRNLSNDLREKYFKLQQEVDKYNGTEIEREIKRLPDVLSNEGVNQMMETSIKDRFNQFKVKTPELDEATGIVKEVWDLIYGLDVNSQLYEAMVTENKCRNEIMVVDAKLDFLKKINEDKYSLRVDLVSKFEAINRKFDRIAVKLSDDFVKNKLQSIEKKYSFYEYLNKNHLADYLRETTINTNYSDVALKYAANNNVPLEYFKKKPLNEVVANLFTQFRDSLTVDEQTVLVLYNSKYRELFDLIYEVENYDSMNVTELVLALSKKKNFSKIKSECFDYIKSVINEECNKDIKSRLFTKINFDTFESFLTSVVGLLKQLKNINNKLRLNSDINMYFFLDDERMSNINKFIAITTDLNTVKSKVKSPNNMIAITCLKNNLPVLYSPYYLDFGNIYDKKDNRLFIKDKTVFDLFIDKDDVKMYMDENTVLVLDYQANKIVTGDLTIVNGMKEINRVNYCRMALFNNVLEEMKK